MTRIISGKLRSVQLSVPKKGTRPTSDRVRESLFQMLERLDALEDTRVLDLFAGSGSLGFEALSRGAESATFVDISAGSYQVLQKNAQTVKPRLDGQKVTLVKKKASSFLQGSEDIFDLIFLDPPYDFPSNQMEAILESLHERASEDSVVVLEQAKRHPFHIPEELYEIWQTKTYGDSMISILFKD